MNLPIFKSIKKALAASPPAESLSLGKGVNKVTSDLGGLSSLKWFQVQSPTVTVLPPEVGLLGQLEELSLSCPLGTLPDSVGQLANLKTLSAMDCQLTRLPETLAGLQNLEVLVVDNNQLRTLPVGLTLLPKLSTIQVLNNPIEALPPEFARLRHKLSLWIGGNAMGAEAKAQLKANFSNLSLHLY